MGGAVCGQLLAESVVLPFKYMCSLVVVNSAANASPSICEYRFSVSVNDLLTKCTGW